jgi:hypothetical protein
MKLTQQIDQLYLLPDSIIEYYDLQSELVDHLANAIEAQIELSTNAAIKYRQLSCHGRFAYHPLNT